MRGQGDWLFRTSGDRHRHPGLYRVGDEAEVLRLAASLERGSEHPLAEAIVQRAEARGVTLDKATEFEAITGKGVKGQVDGHTVALGNAALIRDLGLEGSELGQMATTRQDQGETVMFVVLDGTIAGLVCVADPVKSSTPGALVALHRLGLRIINAAGVPIAAGVLYPFLGILIGPMFAAFAMSASSVSVVLN